MNINGFAICVSLLLFGGLGTMMSAQDAESQAEAISLRSAHIANMEAIQRYDLFFETEWVWVSDKAPIEEGRTFVRVRMEPDTHRCLAIQREIRTTIADTPKGAVDQTRELMHAVLVEGKHRAWHRQFPEPARPIEPSIERSLLFANQVPYVTFIGTTQFPITYFMGVGKYAADEFQVIRSGTRNASQFDGKDTITVQYQDRSAYSKIRFDTEGLVPKSIAHTFITPHGDKVPRWNESYKFEPREGIQLPLQIAGEMRLINRVNGKHVSGIKTYDVDLTWISVNEPFDDSDFDSSLLGNDIELMKMISPSVIREIR